MQNIIAKGNNAKYYINYSWGYYYSAGYLFCKNKIFSLYDELYNYKKFFKQCVPAA